MTYYHTNTTSSSNGISSIGRSCFECNGKRSAHENATRDSSTSSMQITLPFTTDDYNNNFSATTSRKRPRPSLSPNVPDVVVAPVEGEQPSNSMSSSLNENDDCSVDSVLDAVDTILREDDVNQIDAHEAMQQRLPLPDDAANHDPDDYLLMLLHAMFPQLKVQVKSSVDLNAYFSIPTEEQMSNYSTEIVNVVRMNDTDAITKYYNQHGRETLDCCNRFGEGILTMACRRGYTQTVQFLLSSQIRLTVRVRDDGGRTPLHDACWYPEPQLDICTLILQQDPTLFLVADKRGYTPFQYARKSDWYIWRQFLYTNHEALYRFITSQPEIMETFSVSSL